MDFYVEVEGVEIAVAVDQLKVDDVGVLGAEDARHRPQRTRDVAQDYRDPRRSPVRSLAPRQVQPVGIDSARKCVAADDVDFDPFILAA